MEVPKANRPDSGLDPGGEIRRILLVDCDMFYVQVARLEDPTNSGPDELLIVGGSPTGRGVVTSASYGVREYGVRSGMPTAQALKLCPLAKVIPVSRSACAARSKRVKEVLHELSPVVQAASIDEFYLDLSGTERLFHGESLDTSARRIRQEVLKRTEISVSIGGGTRKLIAKMAAGQAKPAGVLVVSPGREKQFMKGFKLREIPGVGPAFAEALEKKGLVEVGDVLPIDISWLEKWLGPGKAQWLWERVRGIDLSSVVPGESRKSISSERTFGSDLTEDQTLEKELLRLTGSIGNTLRRKQLQGRTITVKIRDHDFRTRQSSLTLSEPVESDATIFSVARDLFQGLRKKRRVGVRLLGVGISSLAEAHGLPQLELFAGEAQAEPERDRVVSRVLDDLRGRFGDRAILPGLMFEDPGEDSGTN